jgi:hypothetical protein
LLRDCRFIASIEMHTKGKSVDDAIQIFTKECGSPEPEARPRGRLGPMKISRREIMGADGPVL